MVIFSWGGVGDWGEVDPVELAGGVGGGGVGGGLDVAVPGDAWADIGPVGGR